MERLLSLRRNVPNIASPPPNAPQRSTDYKKKGSGIDRRAMRLHRRSIDQRKMRDITVQRQRGVDTMSPLREVQNVIKEPKKTGKEALQSDLKDRLKKWKEEKELKKKLERRNKKTMFKVHHIEYEKPQLAIQQEQPKSSRTTSSAKRTHKTQSTLNSKSTNVTRVTRSSTKASKGPISAKTAPAASQPSNRRVTRSTARASRTENQAQAATTVNSKPPTRLRHQEQPKSNRTTSNAKRTLKPQNDKKSTKKDSAFASGKTMFTFRKKHLGECQPFSALLEPQYTASSSESEHSEVFPISLQVQTEATYEGISSSESEQSDNVFVLQDVQTAAKATSEEVSNGESEHNEVSMSLLVQRKSTSHGVCDGEFAHSDDVSMPLHIQTQAASEEATSGESDHSENDMTVDDIPVSLQTKSESKENVNSDKSTEEVQLTAVEAKTKTQTDALQHLEPIVATNKSECGEEVTTAVDTAPAMETKSEEICRHGKSIIAEEDSEDTVDESKEKVLPQTADEGKVEHRDTVTTAEAEDPNNKEEVMETAPPKVEDSSVITGAEEEEKNVPYFRKLVSSETDKLTKLCEKWQGIMDATALDDEVLGEIRSTIGKAQLLMDQRFKQFLGLVNNCEFNLGELKTHCSDLSGFWEMVSYQVEDVDRMFASLDELQSNNWVKKVVVTNALVRKPKKTIAKKTKTAKPGGVSKKTAVVDRSAARQRLLAIKAAMKAKATRSKDNDKVVFEGGFFKVESPVKSPKVHCEAGSPLGAAFLRTGNTPISQPGSHHSTPRSQVFTPGNPRLSLQSRLCGPLSKLVLEEAECAMPSKATGSTTPRRTTRSRQGTPTMDLRAKVCTPLVAKICCTPLQRSKGSTATDPPKTPLVCKVGPMQNETTAYPLIPGIGSPLIRNKSVSNMPVFTPLPKITPNSSVSSDLICLDSPTPVEHAASMTGSLASFAAIHATPDMKMQLGTDLIMSPVRRSARRHHPSGGTAQMVVEKLADIPKEMDCGYQLNVSLL